MGNTIRRTFTNERNSSTTSPSSTTADWSEANVLRFISEKKLAPKTSSSNSNKNNEECPICFLEFDMLNKANCCKQSICTDCVVQLKQPSTTKSKFPTTINTSCPFCGKKDFEVYFDPDNNQIENKLLPNTKMINNSKGNLGNNHNNTHSYSSPTSKSCPGSSIHNAVVTSTSTCTSNNNGSCYVTPEQERKLRSHSIDAHTLLDDTKTTANTITDNGNVISNTDSTILPPPVVKSASKSDRFALEQQMKSQRIQYNNEQYNEEIERSTTSRINIPSNRSSNSGSRRYSNDSFSVRIPFRQNNRNHRGNSESLSSPSRNVTSGSTLPSTTTTSIGRDEIGSTVGSTAAARAALNNQFFHSIQDILGSTGVREISSIEQLEELMLMEAIRQSMSDSTPPPPPPSSSSLENTTDSSQIPLMIRDNQDEDPSNTNTTLAIDSPPRQQQHPNIQESVTDEEIGCNTRETTNTINPTATTDTSHENTVYIHRNNIQNDRIRSTSDDFFNSDDDEEDEEFKLALALSMADLS